MHEKTLRLLEFDSIRGKVAEMALNEESARQIHAEIPLKNTQDVEALKRLVSEILERIKSGDEEKRESLPDIGFLFPKLAVDGASLEIDEAYGLGIFVERGETLKKWLLNGKVNYESQLCTLVSAIPDCTAVSYAVFRVLDKDGKLRDLPEFRAINRRIYALTRDLEMTISRYTQNEETRHMLQSAVPSQRDGRIVLAVKANFRGRIKGIVHEVSATGQTLFVEPEEVVERNNDILIETRRLDAEIHRVLREMTLHIAEQYESLKTFYEGIIGLEIIRAKARYAYETKGHFAQYESGRSRQRLLLKKARHPLLGFHAVPIDFSMAEDTETVIITGPNTGGKTVSLKTVGLFALMNQFGLALPAEEGTVLPVFDGVYADIGDEQSLSQSLSTFSAHMTNIASIINVITEDSLVLLDELGSGTDPEEGSAIAMAILDHLIEKRVRLITTTHHSILKNYGYTRERVENASVEFDSKTLSPTYHIVMGIPGESRAVDIASKNGLQTSIIARAQSYLEDKQSDVSTLIRGLKTKYQTLETATEKLKHEEVQLREERRKVDLKALRLRQKEGEIKAGELGHLQRLLEESRKTLENLVREVKEGELSREKTLKVKDFFHTLEETIVAENSILEEEKGILAEEKQQYDSEYGDTSRKKGFGKNQLAIGPGTEVFAGEYKRRGTVLRLDKKGSWIVEIGSLRMSFSETDLHPLPPSETQKKPIIAIPDLASTTKAQFELSLRGMRLEEAINALRQQLDAAVLSGLHEFSVVHGKGDGILQRGVHAFLREQPQVADYYFSRPELGGFGRTEVILKS